MDSIHNIFRMATELDVLCQAIEMGQDIELLCWSAEYAEAYVDVGGQTNVMIDSTAEYELHLAIQSISPVMEHDLQTPDFSWLNEISTQDLASIYHGYQTREGAVVEVDLDNEEPEDSVQSVINEVVGQVGGRAGQVSACHICNLVFNTPYALQRHVLFVHNRRRFQCKNCGLVLSNRNDLQVHRTSCYQIGFGDYNIESNFFRISKDSALHRAILNYKLEPLNKSNDLELNISKFKNVARKILTNHLTEGPFKFNIFVMTTFYKALEPDITIQTHFIKGRGRGLKTIRNQADINVTLDEECNDVVEWVEMYANRASNYILRTVDLI